MTSGQDVHVTTVVLMRGTLLFVVLDAALLALLWWRVKPDAFARLRRVLPAATALAWFGIWSWAVVVFWGRVYSYVFPSWSRWYLPFFQAALTGGVAWIAVTLASRVRSWPVIAYCLLGGVWGALTHVWAVARGIVSEPPMLQGANPAAAVLIAFFEFTFYFCIVVLVTRGAVALVARMAGPDTDRRARSA